MRRHGAILLLIALLPGPTALGVETAPATTTAESGGAPICQGTALPYDPQLVQQVVDCARTAGDARRGLDVFSSTKLGCMSCHRVGETGGSIGPALTQLQSRSTANDITESILWPGRRVQPEFAAWTFVTSDGKAHQGYKRRENKGSLYLFDISTQTEIEIQKAEIDESHEVGSLMPEGLAAAMTPTERGDLLRFLLDLGSHPELIASVAHRHEVSAFEYTRDPLRANDWPYWREFVNRDRCYDFYEKEAAYFSRRDTGARLIPAFSGLDGGKSGHWENQSDANWADDRWNSMDLGSVMAGVFDGPNGSIPKAVCVRLGDDGNISACFNPQTLRFECAWRGGLVKFSSVRHGFLDGLKPAGEVIPLELCAVPSERFVYHGYYRLGRRIVFSYRVGNIELLDSPWVENGKFMHVVARVDRHPLKTALQGGPRQWPQTFKVRGQLGSDHPYTIDTIPLPFDNPWKAPIFCGDHAFLSDGSALICMMHGDVWRATGVDDRLERVTWKRFASGLHQPLGMLVHNDEIYVLGRDQITRLHDCNHDGEADFYECVANTMLTSPASHDFICGLARDDKGNFDTASGNQGLIRINGNDGHVDVLATGLRNPDGIHVLPNGAVTAPASEGDWTPASMICLVPPTAPRAEKPIDFGYGGPKNGQLPTLPLVYLPRGIDHSSGAQVTVPDDRWGPLKGQLIHLSYGDARLFLVLRDEVGGQEQGAIVPLSGDFRSGIHRGKFSPIDGQFYVSGMAGWGNYALDDGCFQRVRYTGGRFQVPVAFHAHENGILIRFNESIDKEIAVSSSDHFAQAWNYRYSQAYGSPELSTRDRGLVAHDVLKIAAVHPVDDHSVFVELPEVQPVNVLYLALAIDRGAPQQIFITVHKLDHAYSALPSYEAKRKTIAPHPLLQDIAALRSGVPNPWQKTIEQARFLNLETGKNLSFTPKVLTAQPGEAIKLAFNNSDVVPHNWVLVAPGQLSAVGSQANRLVADPNAAARQYVPQLEDVIVYTNVVDAGQSATIYFRAPRKAERYPFLCTFPGHWMVMNGELLVQ